MDRQFLVVPPTLCRLIIPQRILEESRTMLASSGTRGLEAVVLWLGSVVTDVEARVEIAYFPRQIAYRTKDGLAVEIPVEEWTGLALCLPPGVFVLAKLHTHGGQAYHSEVDAANPYLSHEGAFSITVPHFARAPLGDLSKCSVNRFQGQKWIGLTTSAISQTFVIVQEVRDV